MVSNAFLSRKNIRNYNLLFVLGITAFLLSLLLFWSTTRNVILSALLSILFVVTLAVGARLGIWLSLFTNRSIQQPGNLPNWTTASMLNVVTFLCFGLCTHYLPLNSLMLLVAILLSMVYALAKLRCWVLGCCGSATSGIPVQLKESLIYLSFAVVLFCLRNQPRIDLLFFACFYPFCRYYFHKIKRFSISYPFIITHVTILFSYAILGFQS